MALRQMRLAAPLRCVHPYEGHGAANRSKAGADRYKSAGFNAIMIHRVAWNLFLLGRGFSIMHCDLDVVWLHDPRPVFDTPRYHDMDMLLQSEQVYGYNGGFYLARARPSVMAGVRHWMADLVHTWETRPKKFEEQHSLVSMVKLAKRGGVGGNRTLTMSSAKLNHSEFPNGKIWMFYSAWTSKAAAFIVHMNWLSNGNKKKHRLVRDDLWFLDADDTRCAAGFDPLAGTCQRFCVPVQSCVPGKPCAYLTNCAALRSGPWHNVSRERCEARRTLVGGS